MTDYESWPKHADVPTLFRAGRLIFAPSVPTGVREAAAYCLWQSRRAGGGLFEVEVEAMAHVMELAAGVVAKKLKRVEEYKAIERTNPGESPPLYRFTAAVYDADKGGAFWHVAREAAAMAPRVTFAPDPGPDCHAVAALAWRLQVYSGDDDVPISGSMASTALGVTVAKSAAALKELVRRGVLNCTSDEYAPGQARRYRFVASVEVGG